LDGVVPTALAGNTLSVADGVVTDGSGNEIPIVAIVPASNGQIFIVDQVLLPAEDKAAAPVAEAAMDDDMEEATPYGIAYPGRK